MKKEVRTAKLVLGDPFAGQYLIIRTNPRMRVFRDMQSGNLERMLTAFASMSIEGNLTDEDDKAIDVTSADGWAEIDEPGLAYLAEQIVEAMKAPKASANGSSTQPLPERETSQPTSTT